ncbi:MAG: hypothetical protein ACAF48_00485 [Candidatus Carsonella ruddii]
MFFFKKIFKKIIGFFKFKNKIIKFGIDPTFYSIHLGHFFIINFFFYLLKKNFLIIIIIGDFTTILKKKIKKNEIILNSICLKSQFYNILGDVYIFFNSIWIYKKKFFFFLKIFNLLNINKYINKNLKLNIMSQKLDINNIIYPLFQAFDSLIINCFLEIGGIDQLLNCICGRFIQKIFNKKKQNLILFFLLEKNDQKISKSKNRFFINEKNNDLILFNKIFYNIKIFSKNYKKKNFFLSIYYKKFFLLFNKKNIFFKKKYFLSFYFKKIFLNNKFFFNENIYKKNFFLNNKLIIKNFFLKKKKYIIKNFINIIIYDK